MSTVYGDGCGLDVAFVSLLMSVLKCILAKGDKKEET